MHRLANHSGWLCIFALAGLTACGVPGIPKPPSLHLPQPVTDLQAVRKGDRVYLAWSVPTRTTDSLAVRHPGPTQVCRGANAVMTACGTPVGEVTAAGVAKKDEATAKQGYVDTLPANLLGDRSSEVFYAVAALNESRRCAGLSNVVAVPAAVAHQPPPDFQAAITADGVVASWKETPSPGGKYFYRVYRRAEGSATDSIAGEVPWGSVQLVDHSFQWEKTYSYRATVVSVIPIEGKPDVEFEGDDTPAVKVFAHDIFPPAVPSGLQAVFSGAGQKPFVDLIWAPDTDADLAGYNIYRREEGSKSRKITSAAITAPAFRDVNVAPGHTYFYSVSAVDVRGNESARSSETSEAMP